MFTCIQNCNMQIKPTKADHAKMALATGGIFGKGPGNSTERNFLPHPYSDFIFAIIIEEYGTVGGLSIVILYLALLYRCVRIVNRSPKAFGALLAAGLSFSLTIQAFANMAVAVGLRAGNRGTLAFDKHGWYLYDFYQYCLWHYT